MTILLSNFIGGGTLKTDSVVSSSIASGTSGAVTIACPANRYLRLTIFGDDSGSNTSNGNADVTMGGRLIGTLRGQGLKAPSMNNSLGGEASYYKPITGGKAEDIVFTFSVATVGIIDYSYEVLQDA